MHTMQMFAWNTWTAYYNFGQNVQYLTKAHCMDHSTHNALCLTFFFQRDEWMGSNARCIWIYLQMLKYIYLSRVWDIITQTWLKKQKGCWHDDEFVWWQFNILLKFSFGNCHILVFFKTYKLCTVFHSEHRHLISTWWTCNALWEM